MSTDPQKPARSLPENPDLRHLKNQAKDLLRSGNAKSLADAQYQLAREYGFASWPKLKAHVESLQGCGQLKQAISDDDVEQVKSLLTANANLHRAPIGYNNNGPLTWAAECRGGPPTPERLAIARWMLENGSDVHQGGDGPLMRAALKDERIPMMEVLYEHGADVNARWDGHYPMVFAACETLAPRALQWLAERGADLQAADNNGHNCVKMLIGTYWRNALGRSACLEVFAEAGHPFPETAPMALHRGRLDLLAKQIERDPTVLHRRFNETEVFPTELGVRPEDCLTYVSLEGATLLHMAVEYLDAEATQWLIDRGADVNAGANIDSDGFGGQTALFHTTVTPFRAAADLARILLRNGADPNIRATFRKQLRMEGDAEREKMHEYHAVTPIEFARSFQEPQWVNEGAIEAIQEHGESS